MQSKAVQMADLEGYIELLRHFGYKFNLHMVQRTDMKSTRIKAAKHVFSQCKKAKNIENDAFLIKLWSTLQKWMMKEDIMEVLHLLVIFTTNSTKQVGKLELQMLLIVKENCYTNTGQR